MEWCLNRWCYNGSCGAWCIPLDAVLVVSVSWRTDVDRASACVVVEDPAQVAA